MFKPTHRFYYNGKHLPVQLIKWEDRDTWGNPVPCSYEGHNDVVVRISSGHTLIVGLPLLEPIEGE